MRRAVGVEVLKVDLRPRDEVSAHCDAEERGRPSTSRLRMIMIRLRMMAMIMMMMVLMKGDEVTKVVFIEIAMIVEVRRMRMTMVMRLSMTIIATVVHTSYLSQPSQPLVV